MTFLIIFVPDFVKDDGYSGLEFHAFINKYHSCIVICEHDECRVWLDRRIFS